MCALTNLPTTSQPCASCVVVNETDIQYVALWIFFAGSYFWKFTTQNQTCILVLLNSTWVYLCLLLRLLHPYLLMQRHICIILVNHWGGYNRAYNCALTLLQISLVCPAPTPPMSLTSCGAVSATPPPPNMETVTIDGKFQVIMYIKFMY